MARTCAPGITEPTGSVTVPRMVARYSCAVALGNPNTRRAKAKQAGLNTCHLQYLLHYKSPHIPPTDSVSAITKCRYAMAQFALRKQPRVVESGRKRLATFPLRCDPEGP